MAFTSTPRGRKRKRTYTPASRSTTRKRLTFATPMRNPAVGSFKGILKTRQNATLVYASLNNLITGVASYYSFRLNGLYDPEVAIGGSQPRGFDQLASIYGKYTVRKAKVEVTFFPGVNSGDQGVVCYLVIHNKNQGFANQRAIEEDRNHKSIISSGIFRDTANGVGIGGNGPRKLTTVVDLAKFSGTSVFMDSMSALVTGDPTDEIVASVYAYDNFGVQATVTCNVRITYSAVFMEPKDPGAS